MLRAAVCHCLYLQRQDRIFFWVRHDGSGHFVSEKAVGGPSRFPTSARNFRCSLPLPVSSLRRSPRVISPDIMLHNAQELDHTIARLTQDPYRDLPRLVVMAATSNEPLIYAGRGGYDQLPSKPVDRSELERAGQPVTEDSIFELYSCTKLPAVIAGLQLLEQGKIALDDDASRYVPELKNVKVFRGFDDKEEPILEPLSRPVTIHMLLTHTSGTLRNFLLKEGLC